VSQRLRIRSIKPEAWQDEKVGALSRDARLLMIGLITMADDEGRFRALPSVILGHAFPWDEIQPRKLAGWLVEIESVGLILRYEHDGKPYAAFRHWRRHQQINKPSDSVLPAPPDPVVVQENSQHNSRSAPVVLREDSSSESCSPARTDRIGSDRKGTDNTPAAELAEQEDREEVAHLCNLLADLIRSNDPNAKVAPDSKRWRDAVRLLIDADGRSPDEIERIIRWSQADDFWRSNILSAPKLRDKFTQLALKANSPIGQLSEREIRQQRRLASIHSLVIGDDQ
jgi:hypothetical protein